VQYKLFICKLNVYFREQVISGESKSKQSLIGRYKLSIIVLSVKKKMKLQDLLKVRKYISMWSWLTLFTARSCKYIIIKVHGYI